MNTLEYWAQCFCAALLIFAALCGLGVWLISRDGAQAGPVMVVANGRE